MDVTTLLQNQRISYSLPAGHIINISTSGQILIEDFGLGDTLISKRVVTEDYQDGPFFYNKKLIITALSGEASVSASLSMDVMKGPKGDPADPMPQNRMIKTMPTLRTQPYRGDDTSGYTAATPSGGTIGIDTAITDITTSNAMAKITIPAGNTSHQTIDYFNLATPWSMNPDDVWMFAFYLPERITALQIQVLTSDGATVSGSDYRILTLVGGGNQIHRGYNLFTTLHVEQQIGALQYGIVGTTNGALFTNSGNQTESNQIRSIRVRVKVTAAQETDTIIYLGSIHTAPADWAKAAVMWMADDVPNSFIDLAIPVIESYGWKTTLAQVSGYTMDPNGNFMYRDTVMNMIARGHHIWGHTRWHDNMNLITTTEQERSLRSTADFWKALGVQSAARYMAWPQGQFNDDAIGYAKANGYVLAAQTLGDAINPLAAGVNPYYINRFTIEKSNPWQVDAVLNGCIKRGQGIIAFGHTAVTGGLGIDSYPAQYSFYIDHLKRWCDLVAARESLGKCVVTTPLEYFRMCGIDPEVHQFAE